MNAHFSGPIIVGADLMKITVGPQWVAWNGATVSI
jgi:hypothetical protein